MTVRVVTDSTSDLPHDLARSLDITIVSLNVHFGSEVFKDGVDLDADEFYRRLMSGGELPKTSQPSVGEFMETYQGLGSDSDGIVSVHISSKLSGTYNAAVQAKGEVDVGGPIEVIDTYQASMGVGMVAVSAAKAAREGADLEEVTRVAGQSVERSQCISLFDTLEYLQKGGRIGKARAVVGTVLGIKPLISVRDGEVHELGKERTRSRGIARLEQVAREFAPLEELSVMHSTSPEDAQMLARNLSELLPEGKEPLIARYGPVIGTYAGPGALGLGLLLASTS
mgnify:CR=1 FL=1